MQAFPIAHTLLLELAHVLARAHATDVMLHVVPLPEGLEAAPEGLDEEKLSKGIQGKPERWNEPGLHCKHSHWLTSVHWDRPNSHRQHKQQLSQDLTPKMKDYIDQEQNEKVYRFRWGDLQPDCLADWPVTDSRQST
eukprot:706934-Pelagomonas_calceolata.AAC.1